MVSEEFDSSLTPSNFSVSQSQAGWALTARSALSHCEVASSYHHLIIYGEVPAAPLPVDASLTSCVIPPVAFLLCGVGSIQKNWLVFFRTRAFLEFD